MCGRFVPNPIQLVWIQLQPSKRIQSIFTVTHQLRFTSMGKYGLSVLMKIDVKRVFAGSNSMHSGVKRGDCMEHVANSEVFQKLLM